jgi:hypothetical protein
MKKIQKVLLVAALVLILSVTSAYTAATIEAARDPAMNALLVLYNHPKDSRISSFAWLDTACLGMTQDGCSLTQTQIPDLLAYSYGEFRHVSLKREIQNWQNQAAIWQVDVNGESALVVVSRSENGWMLDRVVSGPGLTLEAP